MVWSHNVVVTGHVHNELSGGPVYGSVVQAGSIDSLTIVTPGAAAVPVDVAMRNPQPVYTSALSDGFTGREWLVAEIDQFLTRQSAGYVWIEADAGMGKTALVAYLARERGWIVHFARYSNGGTSRVGLQNLAAQLITRYELWDLTSGRMLPEWAATPEGFEALLAQAAEATSEQVVLLVDGADEAVTDPGNQPWGLPGLLPDGVFVVGTYRTGKPPPRADSPQVVLRLAADDERNWHDLLTHLDLVRQEAALASLPVDEIAERCGGVWVYLRYVLDEMRLGLRQPVQLDDLPRDLRSYYLDQLRRWRNDPHWHDTVLPLLATLAAAGEALTIDLLAVMADADERQVREWCQGRLRPFLTATAAPPRRFEIYHASLREQLTEVTAETEEERAWAEDLATAVRAAHNRIADHCLADSDDYALRHLVTHLLATDRVADLDAMLSRENGSTNAWFTAHSDADTLDHYVDDLDAAQAHHAAFTDAAVHAGDPAPDLLVEVRYLLMLSSITSLTITISADLLVAAAQHGVWPSTRIVNHVRRLPGQLEYARTLAAVLPHLPAAQQPDLLAEALAVTEALDVDERSVVRTDLAPFLSEADATRTLAEVVAVDWPATQPYVIAGLAPFLSPAQLDEALGIALAITHFAARMYAVRKLVPHLSTAQCDGAFLAVQAITHAFDRLTMVKLLAPGLSRQRLEDALAAALAVDDDFAALRPVAELIDHLPPPVRPHWTNAALSRADRITDVDRRAATLVSLGRHLSPEQLAEAQKTVEMASTSDARISLLARLAPHLPAAARDAAVARVRKERSRLDPVTFAELAPYMPLDGVTEALSVAIYTARHFDIDDRDAEPLLVLAPHLPPELLATALSELVGIYDEEVLQEILVGLAPMLSADQLATAVRLAADIDDGQRRVATILSLVPHLPTQWERKSTVAGALGTAARIAGHADEAIVSAALLPYLPDVDRGAVCAELVSKWLNDVADTDIAARILRHAAPFLSATDLTHMLQREKTLLTIARYGAVDIALAAAEFMRGEERATVLTELMPLLSADQLDRVLAGAAELGVGRGRVLVAALPHLPIEQRPAVVVDALAALTDDYIVDLDALCALFPYLTTDQLRTALSVSARLNYVHEQSWLLCSVTAYLSPVDLHLVEAAAESIAEPDHRAAVAMALARRLPAPQRVPAVAAVLSEVERLIEEDAFEHTDALTWLASDLPSELASRVLDIATTLPDDLSRGAVLRELGPHLPPELLPRAVDAVEALDSPVARALAFAELATHLPELALAALEAIAGVSDVDARDRALTWLAPHLPTDALLNAVGAAGTASGVLLLLARAVELGEHGTVVGILRAALPVIDRSSALDVLVAALPMLRQLTGPDLGPQVRETMRMVHRWWP